VFSSSDFVYRFFLLKINSFAKCRRGLGKMAGFNFVRLKFPLMNGRLADVNAEGRLASDVWP
jgi:hypothetical protein